jgi:hypothetical protein
MKINLKELLQNMLKKNLGLTEKKFFIPGTTKRRTNDPKKILREKKKIFALRYGSTTGKFKKKHMRRMHNELGRSYKQVING